jgi:hypothetical protein
MLALWRLRPLPRTSYGYQPPPRATARGWRCANHNCAAPVRGRPRRCRLCGWPADPEFDEPWAHEALGAELRWRTSQFPASGGGIPHERLIEWHLKDALLRHDWPAAAAARAAIHEYIRARQAEDTWWDPSFLLGLAVFDAIELGDLDGAAADLCCWLRVFTADRPAEIPRSLANAKSVMNAGVAFLAAPGGERHPRTAEIRKGCLRVVSGCLRADASRPVRERSGALR